MRIFLRKKQKQYENLVHQLKKYNENIFKALRPIVYYNHSEYVNNCYRYSIDGSGYIIKHVNTYLFITARHVLHSKNNSIHNSLNNSIDTEIIIPKYISGNHDLKDRESRINYNFIYSIPIHHELSNSFKSSNEIVESFFSKESQDISIITLDKEFSGEAIEWETNPLALNSKDLGYLELDDDLVAIGFPKKYNYIKANELQNNSSINIEMCVLIGKCTEIKTIESKMHINHSFNDLKNIDGMSGGAVFKFEKTKKLKFVGMIISGDTINGKCLRFLNVNWLNIYLMQTDFTFPFSSQGIKDFNNINKNYIKELKELIGEQNLFIEDDNIKIILPNEEYYVFHKTHTIYFMVINLLYNTDAYKSEYIYKLVNIINFTANWENSYKLLKENKEKISIKLIKELDYFAHNIDNFMDGKLKIEEFKEILIFKEPVE